jgi:sugar phosphate isomerase/epimerase
MPDASWGCVSRRALLARLAAASAGLTALPALVRELEALDTAHVRRPIALRPPIGLQLYTVRALMAKDMGGTLAALAAAGVRDVEFAGYFDRAPTEIRALLDRHGLAAPAAHVPLPATPEGWTPVFDAAEALGHKWLVIPWVGNEVRASLDGWRRLADALNEAGRLAAPRGLRLGYHNHDFEFTVTEGQVPFDLLADRLDRSVVDLELDLYWAHKAGQDLRAMIAARPGRFPLWHLKDAGPAPERAMLDVGAGTIDFRALFALGATTGLRHAFIEHDEPSDPMASVRASASALAAMP